MKKQMRKVFAAILSVAMLVGLMPGHSMTDVLAADSLRYVEGTYSVSYEEGVDAVEYYSSGTSGGISSLSAETITTIAEAKEALRSGLLNRESVITLTLEGEALAGVTTANYESKPGELFQEAVMHNAPGTEGCNTKLGDYIERSIGGYTVGISGFTNSNGEFVNATYQYTMIYYTTLEQEEFVDTKLQKIYASLQLSSNALTETQKVYQIYNWITNHVSYDYTNLNNDENKTKYTAYGALHDGQAVCQGFANLFYRMCMDNGIDCRIVVGTGDGGPHAWNIVKVGTEYYYVDATWDCKVPKAEGQEKPGTLFYFLRDSLVKHIESTEENITDSYTMTSQSLPCFQIEVPKNVTANTLQSSIVVKDLCGNTLTDAQKVWYQTKVTDAAEACKKQITVMPAAIGLENIVLAEESVYAHNYVNDTCTVCGENASYIIAGYMLDENGAGVSGDLSGLHSYKKGETATLNAPALTGYNFVGWYRYDSDEGNSKHYSGEVLCATRSFTFIVTEDADLVAVYRPTGSASVTIDGGSSYTVNGEMKSTSTTAERPIGSKVTIVCNSDNFEYWKNSAGMVVSRSHEYTFTVTGQENLAAVFNTVIENQATVVFESYYGQVMARDQLADNGTMTIPGVPTRYGYVAKGWDFNGDGTFDGSIDTLAAAISRGLNAANKLVRITPIYELKADTYTITVTNGTGAGTYHQNDIVTVTADPATGNQKFSHWKDDLGNVLSYNETYRFYASKTMTVEAVYVTKEAQVEAKGTTKIVDSYKDTTNNSLTFVSFSTVPEGCVIDKAGVIATNDRAIGTSGDGFNASTAFYVRGNAWSGSEYRFTWSKGNVSVGQTWYVRAYLVYTDADGNVNTIYGDMVSQTY